MPIEKSTLADIPEIFRLYRLATAYQDIHGTVSWPEFSRELVEVSISEGRQWKLVENGVIACVWTHRYEPGVSRPEPGRKHRDVGPGFCPA
jgi:hypothetical protein